MAAALTPTRTSFIAKRDNRTSMYASPIPIATRRATCNWRVLTVALLAFVGLVARMLPLYLALTRKPFHVPTASGCTRIVPRVVHATGAGNEPSRHTVRSATDGYTLRYYNDSQSVDFVRRMCGKDVAFAMSCLRPGAFRADVFRMCAMYTVGGVYMDSDILAVQPLDEVFDGCVHASIALDKPSFVVRHLETIEKKQMAFMAAAPGHPMFRCHMEAVVRNVEEHFVPHRSVGITGPIVFHECYSKHSDNVSVGLVDSGRPCSVFRTTTGEIAALQVESGPKKRDFVSMFEHGAVYGCPKRKHRQRTGDVSGE